MRSINSGIVPKYCGFITMLPFFCISYISAPCLVSFQTTQTTAPQKSEA